MDLFEKTGAVFSDCRHYRYLLWRYWSEAPKAVFIMLNPSTADEIENDPTVERCERRARAMGFGGLRVANIFALRSTDPKALYSHPEPIGPANDSSIMIAAENAGIVVCGWGTHGALNNRGNTVAKMLRNAGIIPHYLQLNANGTPKHPLYVGYNVKPQEWSLP